MSARGVAIFAGAIILAAIAHVNVISNGGYWTPHSYVTIAVAIGAACGAVFCGKAWASGRRMLAVCFVLTLAAGEAFGFLATAERLIVSREAAQAPLRTNEEDRAKAAGRVTAAEEALRNLPATSERLKTAESEKAAADAAVRENSASRSCRDNCRQLLQAQADAANKEVGAARAELEQRRASAEQELADARQALNAFKAPVSATPLADKTGFPAWLIDLAQSALGSIAANGLGCCLLIFGAHHRPCRIEIASPAPAPLTSTPLQCIPAAKDRADHAARFALQCFDPGGETELEAIRARYAAWCAPPNRLPDAQIGRALAELFNEAGITIAERGGRLVAQGLSLKPEAHLASAMVETPRRN
jgi:hypothetical protein